MNKNVLLFGAFLFLVVNFIGLEIAFPRTVVTDTDSDTEQIVEAVCQLARKIVTCEKHVSSRSGAADSRCDSRLNVPTSMTSRWMCARLDEMANASVRTTTAAAATTTTAAATTTTAAATTTNRRLPDRQVVEVVSYADRLMAKVRQIVLAWPSAEDVGRLERVLDNFARQKASALGFETTLAVEKASTTAEKTTAADKTTTTAENTVTMDDKTTTTDDKTTTTAENTTTMDDKTTTTAENTATMDDKTATMDDKTTTTDDKTTTMDDKTTTTAENTVTTNNTATVVDEIATTHDDTADGLAGLIAAFGGPP